VCNNEDLQGHLVAEISFEVDTLYILVYIYNIYYIYIVHVYI
jgi:hypothetical protein